MPDPIALRLFIAIAPPEEVRVHADAAIAPMRGVRGVRWVTPDRLHLTLKFLGNTPAEKTSTVKEILAESANRFSRFVVELGEMGAFPNLRKPQVVWLGLGGDGVTALQALAVEIDRALHEAGFPREERPFRPHLTLGRAKPGADLGALVRLLRETNTSWSPTAAAWPIRELELIQSNLRPDGPEYTTLECFPLQPGSAGR